MVMDAFLIIMSSSMVVDMVMGANPKVYVEFRVV